MADLFPCGECGQRVDGAAFHPYLYCVLYKAGIDKQDKFLRDSGYRRVVPRKKAPPSEVMYAVRRTDGETIGDYSFMTTSGPDDWAYVDEDNDQLTEYEMVKMTVERVAVRTFGSPVCDEWRGQYRPAEDWFEVVIESQGEDTWPARDHRLWRADTEADAEIRVAMLPETFICADGYGAYEVRRDQLRIERRDFPAWPLDCDECGQSKHAHERTA